MGDNYGNGYWQEPEKNENESVGFGIASLVLGIVSLLLFCTCINWITGILAIIFGIIQITKTKQKGFAIGGIITAGVSLLFTIILYISLVIGAAASDMRYNDYYDYYYDYYDMDYNDVGNYGEYYYDMYNNELDFLDVQK